MSKTLNYVIRLGSSQIGLTLQGQLVDWDGSNVGSRLTTGFAEDGGGHYSLITTADDSFDGKLLVFNGAATTPLASGANTVVPDAAGTAVTLAASEDVYHADVFLTRDTLNSQDEYTVVWYKNGTPVTSGITLPTLQVVKRSDGTDLVASSTMTQIGSTGCYKLDSTTRLTSGEAAVAIITATIDAASRTWRRPVGRDI